MEGCAVTDSGYDRNCNQRANAGDLPEPLAGWIGRSSLFNLRVHSNDLLSEIPPLGPK
jgi:hypothetical protein